MALTTYQVILQSQNGKGGAWLDYCREQVFAESLENAMPEITSMIRTVSSRAHCKARARVECWEGPADVERHGTLVELAWDWEC